MVEQSIEAFNTNCDDDTMYRKINIISISGTMKSLPKASYIHL